MSFDELACQFEALSCRTNLSPDEANVRLTALASSAGRAWFEVKDRVRFPGKPTPAMISQTIARLGPEFEERFLKGQDSLRLAGEIVSLPSPPADFSGSDQAVEQWARHWFTVVLMLAAAFPDAIPGGESLGGYLGPTSRPGPTATRKPDTSKWDILAQRCADACRLVGRLPRQPETLEDHRPSFAYFAEELRRLEKQEPRPTVRDANDQINRTCADAVRAYSLLANRGVKGFHKELVQGLAGPFEFTGVPSFDAKPWRHIAEDLANRCPEIPPNPCLAQTKQVWQDQIVVGSTSGHSIRASSHPKRVDETKFPPELWPVRARNYAKCMDAMHRMASEEDLRVAERTLKQTGAKPESVAKNCTSTAVGRRRGRPSLTEEEKTRRTRAVQQWQRAKSTGISMKDFCASEKIPFKTLELWVNWNSQSRRRG